MCRPILRLTGRLGWSTMASLTTLYIGRPGRGRGYRQDMDKGTRGEGGLYPPRPPPPPSRTASCSHTVQWSDKSGGGFMRHRPMGGSPMGGTCAQRVPHMARGSSQGAWDWCALPAAEVRGRLQAPPAKGPPQVLRGMCDGQNGPPAPLAWQTPTASGVVTGTNLQSTLVWGGVGPGEGGTAPPPMVQWGDNPPPPPLHPHVEDSLLRR